jgi:hypothetical protein
MNKCVLKIRCDEVWSYVGIDFMMSLGEMRQHNWKKDRFYIDSQDAKKLFREMVFERIGTDEAVVYKLSNYPPYSEYEVLEYFLRVK